MSKREDVAAILLNRQYNGSLVPDADALFEGRSTEEQDGALEVADAIIAAIEKPEYRPEEAMGRWYATKDDHW